LTACCPPIFLPTDRLQVVVLLGARSTRLRACRARFLALLVQYLHGRSARVSVVSSFRLGAARKPIPGLSAVSASAADAVSPRRVQGLHQVGCGHRLELSTCRLAGWLCRRRSPSPATSHALAAACVESSRRGCRRRFCRGSSSPRRCPTHTILPVGRLRRETSRTALRCARRLHT